MEQVRILILYVLKTHWMVKKILSQSMCLHVQDRCHRFVSTVYQDVIVFAFSGRFLTNRESGRVRFHIQAHFRSMMLNAVKPEPGVDYPQKDVLIVIRVECEGRHLPEDALSDDVGPY